MTEEKHVGMDRFIVDGLHRDDFEWAAKQYEETGYVLVAFLLDCDNYHWKAVYVKVENLEKNLGGRGSLRVCPSLSAEV